MYEHRKWSNRTVTIQVLSDNILYEVEVPVMRMHIFNIAYQQGLWITYEFIFSSGDKHQNFSSKCTGILHTVPGRTFTASIQWLYYILL